MNKLRWGLLTTGRISRVLAKTINECTSGTLQAVGSRKLETAQAFAREFEIPTAYGSYDELIADPDVDAIFIGNPHPQHHEWAIKAAKAKKHVLCEKPAAMTAAEAEEMIAAARDNGVFFLEAFMYRCVPQTEKVVEIIRSGRLGKIGLIQFAFSVSFPLNREDRVFSNELGGGAILDIGCYTMSWARLVAGAALGKPFADPLEIKAFAEFDPVEGTDIYTAAVVKFDGGILAELSVGLRLKQDYALRIYGTDGWMLVPYPANPKPDNKVTIYRENEVVEEIATGTEKPVASYEVDVMAKYSQGGQPVSPLMTWDDTIGNMRALDMWRQAVGLVYRSEKAG